MSADYHPWGYNQRTYEPTGTKNTYICMYVHNFAYTLYNAEFRQDFEFEVEHRCYQRTFWRNVYITYFLSYTGNMESM